MWKCTALLRSSKNEQLVLRHSRFLEQSMEKDRNDIEGTERSPTVGRYDNNSEKSPASIIRAGDGGSRFL
jgi:hypothetical protein